MKLFIDYNTVRNNTLKLIHSIYTKDNFVPDVLYASLRGGAYMANIIGEYYKIARKDEKPVLYAAVVARSYTDLHIHTDKVSIDGWTYSPEHIRPGDKIMIVDDICDSGKTLTTLTQEFLKRGIPRENIKIVVHDYKQFTYSPTPSIVPDYYVTKHVISNPEEDCWIHYNSHELMGLSGTELDFEYISKDSELQFLKPLLHII